MCFKNLPLKSLSIQLSTFGKSLSIVVGRKHQLVAALKRISSDDKLLEDRDF